MEYSEKLKDPRWQKLRLEIFNRDEWACQADGFRLMKCFYHSPSVTTSIIRWVLTSSKIFNLLGDLYFKNLKTDAGIN